MSDYLKCGHPKGCERKHTIECRDWFGLSGEPWCAACVRGGWVKPSEGLPEHNCQLLVAYDLGDGGRVAFRSLYAVGDSLPRTAYLWMYWPAPPPLPGD